MTKKYNWGIIGCGKIANKFAHDLLLVEEANLYAVASRSLEKATIFGKKYQAEKFYGSYQELAADPNIDAIYIATPHVFHCKNTLMCLDAGKAVLCEKPFGMNKGEIKQMIAKAKEKNVFLMEAFWSRFFPTIEKMLELIEEGKIGNIVQVRADFGFKAEYDTTKRLFNKELGGGSLLDIGLYPVFLSLITLGKPKKITAKAIMSDTAVDAACMMIFEYDNNKTAVLDSTLLARTPSEGWIVGSEGSIKLHTRFHEASKLSLFNGQQELQKSEYFKIKGFGYSYEIQEVINCLKAGKVQSDKLPWSFSLDLMEVLDRVREEIGLVYN